MSRVAALLLCLAHLGAAAPPCYKKADTWQETLRISREALMEKEAKDAAVVPPYNSRRRPHGPRAPRRGTEFRNRTPIRAVVIRGTRHYNGRSRRLRA